MTKLDMHEADELRLEIDSLEQQARYYDAAECPQWTLESDARQRNEAALVAARKRLWTLTAR